MNELALQTEWYDALVSDCKDIIVETTYRYRMELIEAKHAIGERICTDTNFKKIQGSKRQAVLQKMFSDIGIGKSEGYNCVQFYEKYPKLSAVTENSKEQKNLSWDKIKRNYLPAKDNEEPKECTHDKTITICSDCRARIK